MNSSVPEMPEKWRKLYERVKESTPESGRGEVMAHATMWELREARERADKAEQRILDLEAQLAASYSANEGLCEEVSRMGVDLAALDWIEIAPELSIDKHVVLGRSEGTSVMAYQGGYKTGAEALADDWTHYVRLNPPAPAKEAADDAP